MSDPQSWDLLNRKTRNLESTIDARLTSYSSLASKISRSADLPSSSTTFSSSGGVFADHTTLDMSGSSSNTLSEHLELESELQSLITQLSEAVDRLTGKLDDPSIPPTTAQLHAVQRHREVLFDFTRDFRTSKTNIRHAIDRRNLLGNVQGDINAYKLTQTSDTDSLLAERSRIDNSHSMIDQTLEQAYATRSDFSNQTSTLQSISNRMSNTTTQIPSLNSIITLIGRRRTRDSVIMGFLIATLTVLLLMFMFR